LPVELAHEVDARSLRAFALFASAQEKVDGFVFQIKAAEATLDGLCAAVRRLLTALSDADPTGYRCMAKSFIGGRGWVFEFGGSDFFVTTFSPCYDVHHPRHTFGVEDTFVLLQPYHSFLLHGIGHDTPHTSWEQPITSRDRIRVRFRDAGRPYPIPPSTLCPAAFSICYPLDAMRMLESPICWWSEETPDDARRSVETNGAVST
jgi:hypothetical protein